MKAGNVKWVRLGDYISQRRENNSSLKYGIDLIEGVNSNGEFQPTKALTDNINLKPYKVVRHGDIVYNPSRLNIGSLAYRTGDMCIVSHLYQVFYIKEKYQSKLSAEFLTLYLRRSEFYRYVDYDNFASQRAEYNLRKLGELLIPLPSPDEQQKVVNAWKAFREIKEQNEAKAAPLMQVCQSYIQELKHKYSLQEIGPYIEECDERNVDLSVRLSQGIANTKVFQAPKQVALNSKSDKIVRTGQFGYNRATTRNGEKISIAYRTGADCTVSSAYGVFKITNEEIIEPYFLWMWVSRPEFDRYARFKSHGSVREVMDWEEMCKVELPVPDIEKQRKIVKAYKTITDRIALKQKINDNLVATLQIIYKKMFLESQNTYITKPLADLCSKIGSGATPKGGKAAYFDKGISLIRSMNVFDYFFSYPELAHISQIQANALANVEIQQADVLFNITGVSVTRCCVVPDDVLPARVNQHVMIIRPYKGKNMSYYIMCTLCTSENKAKLLGIGQSGSTREAINKQELERFEIPVPSDEELERFGEIATKIYALIFSNTNEIRMLCDMKDTLLTKLSSY